MLRRYVASPLALTSISVSYVVVFSSISSRRFVSSASSTSSKYLSSKKFKHDDDFGFGQEDDQVEDGEETCNQDLVVEAKRQDGEAVDQAQVVYIQNPTSMDFQTSSARTGNSSSSIVVDPSTAAPQTDEAASSRAVAKIWPEILTMSAAVDASKKIVMTVEDEIDRNRMIGDGLRTQRAVEISRELVRTGGNVSLSSGNNPSASTAVSSRAATPLEKMSPQDVGFCFGVLQSVVEQSDTRLEEKFIVDAAYAVFSAELASYPSCGKDVDGNNNNNSHTSNINNKSIFDNSQITLTEQRSLLATATATTWKSLVSSGYINDDYLLGVGLARSVDLVESMDIASIISLLHGLRKFNRIHFTLHEMEYHRASSTGGDGAAKGRADFDLLSNAGFQRMGRERGSTMTTTGVEHPSPDAPTLATLLREAKRENDVIHPNLIDMVTQEVEKRIRFLIREATDAMEELEKEETGEQLRKDSADGDVDGDAARKTLLAGTSAQYKNQQEEDDMTLTVELDGGGAEAGTSAVVEQKAENPHRPMSRKREEYCSRDSPRAATDVFIPICRPNELLELVAEMCRVPSGVSDKMFWKDLTRYSAQYFAWSRRKAQQIYVPASDFHGAQNDEDNALTRLVTSHHFQRHNMLQYRKRSLFETERLLALLPPLVKPITAMSDPMDAIATAKRVSSNNSNNGTKNSLVVVVPEFADGVDVASMAIPTAGLLALVSNELAQCAGRHVQIIGRRNPDLMRNLRRAFEEFPILFETSPALWDVVRTAKIPRLGGAAAGQTKTGLDRSAGKLGKLPRVVQQSKHIFQKRVLSKEFMKLDPRNLPYAPHKDPFAVKKPILASARWTSLKGETRINRGKRLRKLRKFSKGKYNARRLGEASHQQNFE